MSIQLVLEAIETQLDELADEIAVLEQERDRLYAARTALDSPRPAARREQVNPPPKPKAPTVAKVKPATRPAAFPCPECDMVATTAAALGSHRSRLHRVAGRGATAAAAVTDALADLEREVLGDG
jgi:hypothetical protein